jgi:hypothetical protein
MVVSIYRDRGHSPFALSSILFVKYILPGVVLMRDFFYKEDGE